MGGGKTHNLDFSDWQRKWQTFQQEALIRLLDKLNQMRYDMILGIDALDMPFCGTLKLWKPLRF